MTKTLAVVYPTLFAIALPLCAPGRLVAEAVYRCNGVYQNFACDRGESGGEIELPLLGRIDDGEAGPDAIVLESEDFRARFGTDPVPPNEPERRSERELATERDRPKGASARKPFRDEPFESTRYRGEIEEQRSTERSIEALSSELTALENAAEQLDRERDSVLRRSGPDALSGEVTELLVETKSVCVDRLFTQSFTYRTRCQQLKQQLAAIAQSANS